MNFSIIENYTPRVEYNDFKKDFLDPSINVKTLQEKYDISRKQYCNLREQVLDETGLTSKPSTSIKDQSIQLITDKTYIRKYKNNNYFIQKIIKGKRRSFGIYSNMETARKVRDELIKNNWDKNLADELQMKYGVTNKNRLRKKALKQYNDFETLFLKGNSVKNIKKTLNLTDYQYNLLSKKVREKHNLKSKKRS